MKNKKGFSLLELLAVIAIIAIVATIGIYSSITIKKKMNKKMFETTLEEIMTAAEKYGTDNKEEIIDKLFSEDEKIKIKGYDRKYKELTVEELIETKYVSPEDKDEDNNPVINHYETNLPINDLKILVYETNDSGRISACIPYSDMGDEFIDNESVLPDPEEYKDLGIYCSEYMPSGMTNIITVKVDNADKWAHSKKINISVLNKNSDIVGYKIVENAADCKDLTAEWITSGITEETGLLGGNGQFKMSQTRSNPDESATGSKYYVCAKAADNTVSSKAFIFAKIDHVNPGVEDITLTDEDSLTESKELTFTLTDDNSGPAAYKVVTNEADCNTDTGYIESTSTGSYEVLDNQTYYICVKDQAGNIGSASKQVNAIDAEPKITDITVTPNNSTWAQSKVLSFKALKINLYGYYVQKGEVACPTTKASYTPATSGQKINYTIAEDLNTTGVNYTICAIDNGNHIARVLQAVRQIDTKQPVISVTGANYSTTQAKFTITLTTSVPSGIKKYEYSSNGTTFTSINTNTTVNLNYTTGSYFFRATSNAGVVSNVVTVPSPKSTYKITLDNQGATTNPSVTYFNEVWGSKYTTSAGKTMSTSSNGLTKPTKTYNTFNGYYTGTNCSGTQVIKANGYLATTNYKLFSEDSTVYACWTPVTYTLTFYKRSGESVSPTSQAYNAGAAYESFPTPTKANYTFVGWSTSSSYCTTSYLLKTTDIPTTSRTVYACWSRIQYTLTFNKRSDESVSPTSKTYNAGSTYGSFPTPSKTNHTFVGWSTSETNCSTSYILKTSDMPTQSMTVYACWNKIQYTLTFYQRSGESVSPTSKTYEAGVAYGSFPTPTKTNYTFVGWSTSSSYCTTSYLLNTTDIPNQNRTVYACWQKSNATITFNADGGTVSPTSISVKINQAIGTLPTPTKPGFLFGGWYSKKLGQGTGYTSTSTISSDITVYAFWYRDAAYLKNNMTTTSGVGLYNVGSGVYRYKGGGCAKFKTPPRSYWDQCTTLASSDPANFIRLSTTRVRPTGRNNYVTYMFRIMDLDNIGIKVVQATDDTNSIYESPNPGYKSKFSDTSLYTTLNGTYKSDITSPLKNKNIILYTTYRQSSPYVRLTSDDSYNWYSTWVNYENTYSNYLAYITIPRMTDTCLYTSKTSFKYVGDVNTTSNPNLNANSCSENNWFLHSQNEEEDAAFYTTMITSYNTNLIGLTGNVTWFSPTTKGYVRPVFYLTSSVKFTGTGTKSDPYVIWDNY